MHDSTAAGKPRVWWINHYAVTPDMPGGTRHYDLGAELVQRGFDVRIFASDVSLSTRKRQRLLAGELYKVEPCSGVDFTWVRSAEYVQNNGRRVWNMLTFSANLARVARWLPRGERPDVVIGSSPHPFAAVAAGRLASRFGVPFVLELRDLWPEALVDMGEMREGQPAVRVLRAIERNLYHRADAFVILARGSEGYLTARGIPGERILYVPNGVHLGHFRPTLNREEARSRYGFTRFTIIYTGAHGPANSLQTIVRAAHRLRGEPIEFFLVGDGPSKPALESAARDQGAPSVRFLDPVPKASIPDLLLAADAGVITLKDSRAFAYAVSPNKLFDYMGASLPVLCAVPGDMAEMVREAEAGLTCRPEDPESLADAALRLSRMPETERAALGRNGFEFLSAHYSREHLADRLAQTLRVLSARAPFAVARVHEAKDRTSVS